MTGTLRIDGASCIEFILPFVFILSFRGFDVWISLLR